MPQSSLMISTFFAWRSHSSGAACAANGTLIAARRMRKNRFTEGDCATRRVVPSARPDTVVGSLDRKSGARSSWKCRGRTIPAPTRASKLHDRYKKGGHAGSKIAGMKNVAIGTAILLAALSAAGQSATRLPEASPAATVGQTIGITDVNITYHRPAVNKRTIWNGLVPYGT